MKRYLSISVLIGLAVISLNGHADEKPKPNAWQGKSGEEVYNTVCFACHKEGVADAPKLGDKAAWEPRIATGMDALYEATIKGKGVMPAKGGNPALSDDEVKAAVDYMVEQVK